MLPSILVMEMYGGLGKEASVFVQKISKLHAETSPSRLIEIPLQRRWLKPLVLRFRRAMP